MDEFLPLLLAHRDRCLTDEPETLHFEVLVPKETANQLLVYEEYQDEAAWHAHLNAASFARIVSEATNMVDTSPESLSEKHSSAGSYAQLFVFLVSYGRLRCP